MSYRMILLGAIFVLTLCAGVPNFTVQKESAHFRVLTTQPDASVVDCLKRAEQVYPRATEILQCVPTAKIDISLFACVADFHTFFNMSVDTPAWKINRHKDGHIFIVSPTNSGLYHSYGDVIERLGGSVMRAVMYRVPKLGPVPYWFEMGFGSYEAFGEQVPTFYQGLIKNFVQANKIPTLLEFVDNGGPAACSFVALLVKEKGLNIIPLLVRDFASFEKLVGMSEQAFYEKWVLLLKNSCKQEEIMIIEGASEEKIKLHNTIEPQFPSVVSQNQYGLCLRAAQDLKKGTVVATADFVKTEQCYVAGHPEHKFIALMHVSKDGVPTWGRIRGKWAFCNHSCDPTCDIDAHWNIVTNRDVLKGQELTTSYDAFVPNFPWQENWNFVCQCGAPNCRKVINKYRMDITYPTGFCEKK